jgi:ABC-2 type transport system permease protein
MIREALAICDRELKHWYREKIAIFMSLIQPLIWLGLFGNTLGNAPQLFLNVLGAPNYLSFMTPGIITMTVLFTSLFAGMSVIWDKRFGYINKLLVAPISRTAIVGGKMMAATIRGVFQGFIVLAIALFLGVTIDTGILGLVLIFVITGLFGLGLASISIAAAASMKTHETFMAFVNLINLPLMFLSNALFPTTFMPTWMRTVASVNPFSFCVDAVRTLMIGSLDWTRIMFDVEALAIFTFITTSLGIMLFRRATR